MPPIIDHKCTTKPTAEMKPTTTPGSSTHQRFETPIFEMINRGNSPGTTFISESGALTFSSTTLTTRSTTK